MILIDTGKMEMVLTGSPEPVIEVDTEGIRLFRQEVEASVVVETVLTIRGSGEVTWPNREGEIFFLSDVYEKLRKLGRGDSGISLCWPATASVSAVGILEQNLIHTFLAEPDPDGNTRFLELTSHEPGIVCFTFKGGSVSWRMKSLPLFRLSQSPKEPIPGQSIYQIGLIGPDGETEVPEDRGFGILADAAGLLREKFGNPVSGDILHIFGYAEGHDRGYPDYTPSKILGGTASLKTAIIQLSELGYDTSLYLNARLVELNRLDDYPDLKNAVLSDDSGRPVIEVYRGRDFAVMNPSSSQWIDHLLAEAWRLKELGTTWVQLDQVAGRASPLSPGKSWGMGYKRLIEGIREMGLKVWIQGVSDFYPADAFEATWRAVSILEDGTLRGGWPLGFPDTNLIESVGFSGSLIVPESKQDELKMSGLPVISDRSARGDKLPMWNSSWPS